jgi:hypothetical protein
VAQLNRGRVSDPAQAALSGSHRKAPGSAGGYLNNQLPNLAGVSFIQSEGISNYNGLQTSFQRRFTISKSME